jgi:hypothetical protein
MASDEDYAAFLEQVNADPGAKKKPQGEVKAKTVDDGEAPKTLRDVVQDEVYVSEADEPWEVVSLRMEGEGKETLPDEGRFWSSVVLCLLGSAFYYGLLVLCFALVFCLDLIYCTPFYSPGLLSSVLTCSALSLLGAQLHMLTIHSHIREAGTASTP